MPKYKKPEVIAIEYFDFMMSETRQRRFRIEAETVEEATAIAEDLWEEKHELMMLTESDVIMTKLSKQTDELDRLIKTVEQPGAPVRVVVLEPERDARVCCVNMSLDMLDENKTSLAFLDENIVLIFGKDEPVNRMVTDKDGRKRIIYGTAIICGIEGDAVVSLPNDEAEAYKLKYDSPGEILVFDEFIFHVPR